MKKSILLAIAILMMIFGITTNVYALSYDYYLGNEIQFANNEITKDILISDPTNTNNWKNETINFDTNIVNSNAKFIRFSYAGQIQNLGYFENNIVWSETCTERVNPSADFTIRFADNSTASITRTAYQTLCDLHNTSGTITNNTFDVSDFNFLVYLKNANGSWPQCEIENGFILCPIESGKTYTGLRFTYYGNKSNMSFITYRMKLSNQAWEINNGTQQIINNQNQNTTTISNNITNLNDNILNSSLNSNTSSDASNIGSNDINSSSKNVILDFMLMPINFINNILNSFGNTCATLCIGNCGSGHDNEWRFVFPCIDIKSIIGDTIYNTIDVLMCFGMVFAFLRSVVGFLKKALLLESDISSEVRIF